MEVVRLLGRYALFALSVAAPVEWLFGRTISRLASAPMLTGQARQVVEGIGGIGFRLVSPTFILALTALLAGLVMLVGRAASRREYVRLMLAFYLTLVAGVAAAHTFAPTARWLNISFSLLVLAGLVAIAAQFTGMAAPLLAKTGLWLVVLGWAGWLVYVLVESLFLDRESAAGVGLAVLDAGELAAVLAPYAFFAAVALPGKQWRRPVRWITPVILMLLFSAANVADALFNQGFTGVFTTWSLGFHLVWPWPLYSVGLLLYVYTLLTLFSHKRGARSWGDTCAALGLLLLLPAGLSLQVPYQHVLALLSTLLISGLFAPLFVEQALEGGVGITAGNALATTTRGR